jgi:site-specific DNA-methyltransferase (adenine-specific)
MELLKRTPDKFYDLAIVDPPYGIDASKKFGLQEFGWTQYKRSDWDSEIPKKEYFDELFRVSKNQIVWGANHFISRMPYDSACWLMWDKKFSDDVSFSQFEMAWTSLEGTCKKYDKHPTQENRIHPTQKPISLYDWIYHKYAKEGDLILDTHLGSGSSRIAANKAGLSFVGCELDKEYFEAQEKRYKNFTAQLRLF